MEMKKIHMPDRLKADPKRPKLPARASLARRGRAAGGRAR